METTSETNSQRRSRRSSGQWARIIADSMTTGETSEQLARRLCCALSTVEKYRKQATRPEQPRGPAARATGFVEVRSAEAPQGMVTLLVPNGVRVTFQSLPPPDYLTAALGLAS